jgi:hypothetical protein
MRQAAHARALEVQKYCCTVPRVHLSQRYSSGLVALAMEIHFLAIDKSNVAEGIARSWTKVHPSILPRQPEATIHCNAASVRPAQGSGECISCSRHPRNLLVDSCIEENKTGDTSSITRGIGHRSCDSRSCNSTYAIERRYSAFETIRERPPSQ